jgi:hypothetical protein
MRKGTLYQRKQAQSLSQAVHAARLHFEQASHTNGHIPVEARFNPVEAPAEVFIDGLVIRQDPRVPIQHIQVTTEEMEETDG